MRRVFIMRKDLNMSVGKLLTQTYHCAETYWTHGLRANAKPIDDARGYIASIKIPKDVYEQYVCGMLVKTVCEARNKNHLLKAKTIAEKIGLVEGVDFGLIYDKCLTELAPEEEDGTTLTGIWLAPLDDERAHSISKKYQLYK